MKTFDRVVVERVLDGETTVGAQLVVDGEVAASGDFGGEPEDNCESRDYNWVVPMIESAIKAAIAAEREHCWKICDARRRAALRQGSTDAAYMNGKVDMAAECVRLIRGEE